MDAATHLRSLPETLMGPVIYRSFFMTCLHGFKVVRIYPLAHETVNEYPDLFAGLSSLPFSVRLGPGKGTTRQRNSRNSSARNVP